ncbi:MAG: type II toxin-antitoxin system death-on-curing family toxin [Bacteroidota bacterium]
MRNKAISFLTRDEVLEIHKLLIARFGGKSGVTDLGLLESALYRPKTGYYKEVIEMSAALFESLIMNNPFVDGNKRVAFFATDIFLRLNGYKFKVKPTETYDYLIGLLSSGNCTYENLLPWLRKSVVSAD